MTKINGAVFILFVTINVYSSPFVQLSNNLQPEHIGNINFLLFSNQFLKTDRFHYQPQKQSNNKD